MNILLVEPQSELAELLALKLTAEFGGEVTTVESARAAIDCLKGPQGIDCVISEHQTPAGTGADVLRHIRNSGASVAFILCSAAQPDCDPAYQVPALSGYAPKPAILAPLTSAVRALITKKGLRTPEQDRDAYCQIATTTLLKFRALSCDLFVRLPEGRFVKIFSAQDSFDSQDFERFSAKSVEHLYIHRKDSAEVIDRAIQTLIQVSSSASGGHEIASNVPIKTPGRPDPLLQAATEALEIVAEFNERLGFTDEVQELTRRSIDLALTSIRKKPEISVLLDWLGIDAGNYVSSHSVALAHFSCGIASLMGWISETTFLKLASASFMHDLTLRDPELARIQTQRDLNARRISPSDPAYAEVMNHPEHAAGLLDELDGIPLGAGTLVRQHHERPSGDGFPGRLTNSQISPLSCVFILSHELLILTLDREEPQDLETAIDALLPQYESGQFKKILLAISNALMERGLRS